MWRERDGKMMHESIIRYNRPDPYRVKHATPGESHGVVYVSRFTLHDEPGGMPFVNV
jgi:hypothetical protein